MNTHTKPAIPDSDVMILRAAVSILAGHNSPILAAAFTDLESTERSHLLSLGRMQADRDAARYALNSYLIDLDIYVEHYCTPAPELESAPAAESVPCPACAQGLSWDGVTEHVAGCPDAAEDDDADELDTFAYRSSQ